MNGSSSSNKKATVKSLTSKRLTDFLEETKKSYKEFINSLPNHEVSPTNIGKIATDVDKNSALNLEPATFGTDEIVDEAPVLFVGSTSFINVSHKLEDIIESYKNFKEITSLEEKDVEGNEFGLVINNRT